VLRWVCVFASLGSEGATRALALRAFDVYSPTFRTRLRASPLAGGLAVVLVVDDLTG